MLALPAPALAQQSPSPSVDQYVERVPTAEGPKPSAAGPKYKRNARLPANVRQRLREEGGADAQALEDIATAAGLGAPEQPRGGTGGGSSGEGPVPGGTPSRAVSGESAGKGAVPAVAEAAFGSGSTATALLVVGLLGTTIAVGAAALARRRTTRTTA